MALVDAGAAISIMSLSCKQLLGRKVMFKWDQSAMFHSGSEDLLCPVGVRSAKVCLGGTVFLVEFAVLPQYTHNVILGIDFLRMCGATVDSCTGEFSVDGCFPPDFTEASLTCANVFCVSADTVVPPMSILCIPVSCSSSGNKVFDVNVMLNHQSYSKIFVVIPHCLVLVSQGCSRL